MKEIEQYLKYIPDNPKGESAHWVVDDLEVLKQYVQKRKGTIFGTISPETFAKIADEYGYVKKDK